MGSRQPIDGPSDSLRSNDHLHTSQIPSRSGIDLAEGTVMTVPRQEDSVMPVTLDAGLALRDSPHESISTPILDRGAGDG